MIDPIEVLWTPIGENLPALGSKALVDVSDGDTPNVRMAIRMLSIDTPEVTAKSENGAQNVDAKFAELVQWLKDGVAPVREDSFRDYLIEKLDGTDPGTLQFEQGTAASTFFKEKVAERLERENGKKRSLFLRTADAPFDNYNRILAYVSPSYTAKERAEMTRRERATFNLDLIDSGWAMPFVLFPSIPGELDLPIFLEAAASAQSESRGQYADSNFLPAYEYRMCEKLYSVTKKLAAEEKLSAKERFGWRTRYCADIRTRELFGPESYLQIPQPYRLWVWPSDVQKAIGLLNLVPKFAQS